MTNIKALIFDWAGTIVDEGNSVPILSFREAFAVEGMKVSDQEILMFMGMSKKEHVKSILSLPLIQENWYDYYGVYPSDKDIDRISTRVNSIILKRVLEQKFQFIDGFHEIYRFSKLMNWKVATTTGYNRLILNNYITKAQERGVSFDSTASSSEVKNSRPFPDMIHYVCKEMRIKPENCVKIGDTEVDVGEGINANVGLNIRTVFTGLPKNLQSSQNFLQIKSSAKIHPNFYVKTLKCVLPILRRI